MYHIISISYIVMMDYYTSTVYGVMLCFDYLTYNGTIRYISTVLNNVYYLYYFSTCIAYHISTYVILLQYLIKYTAMCYIFTEVNIYTIIMLLPYYCDYYYDYYY